MTDGGRSETQLGQMFGNTWNSGSALLSYDYFDAAQLDSRDRSYTALLVDPTYLVPEERKHSAVASLSQALTDRVELSAEAMYSERDAERIYVLFDGLTVADNRISARHYGGSLQAAVDLSADWRITVSGAHSTSKTYIRYFRSGIRVNTLDTQTTLESLDAVADGKLFDMPGGPVRLAVGTHHRSESYDSRGAFIPVPGGRSRDIYAGFAELLVPLVGVDNRLPGVRSLELRIAGRYEDYSDVGDGTHPKVGLLWSPLAGLNIRGSYGKSFRAPLLSELVDSRPNIVLLPLPDVVGVTPTLFVEGIRNELDPEQATTWTAGLDFAPPSLPNLTMSLTYFDVGFEDRITSPFGPTTSAALW